MWVCKCRPSCCTVFFKTPTVFFFFFLLMKCFLILLCYCLVVILKCRCNEKISECIPNKPYRSVLWCRHTVSLCCHIMSAVCVHPPPPSPNPWRRVAAAWPAVLIKHVVNVFTFLIHHPSPPPRLNGIQHTSDVSGALGGDAGTQQTSKELSENKFSDSPVINGGDACAAACGVMNNKCSSERTSNWQQTQQKARRAAWRARRINKRGMLAAEALRVYTNLPANLKSQSEKLVFPLVFFTSPRSISSRETSVGPQRSGCSLFLCLPVNRRGYTMTRSESGQ